MDAVEPDPLADLFPGTEDAELPEYESWGPPPHTVHGRLMPAKPREAKTPPAIR